MYVGFAVYDFQQPVVCFSPSPGELVLLRSTTLSSNGSYKAAYDVQDGNWNLKNRDFIAIYIFLSKAYCYTYKREAEK